MKRIATVAVCGAGTMGSGIAQVFACAGHPVTLFDQIPAVLQKANAAIKKNLDSMVSKEKMTADQAAEVIERVSYISDISHVNADFIIEAIIENLSAKQELFSKLAESNPEAILATNTSTIPVTRIAKDILNPQRIIGVHFFNPAPLMKLVEIISGVQTAPEIALLVLDFIKSCGKEAISVKDAPGFIVNRVARQFYTESQKIVEEQLAEITNLDRLMESCGFKMGPFKLMDLIGNDVNYAVTSSLFDQFMQEPRFRPSRLQEQLVSAGLLGRKSGRGFYSYE